MEKTLKTLLPSGQEIITVKGSDTLAHALDLMREHDFNQLPIVTADHRCLGEVVTIRSVLDSANLFNAAPEKLRVSQAAVKVETFRSDEDLLEALDDIQEEGFAIIVDGDRRLIGIVTTADTTEHLRRYSEDIMLVAFAERSLKAAIQALYDGQPDQLQDAIARACDRSGDAAKVYSRRDGVLQPQPDSSGCESVQRRVRESEAERRAEAI